MSLVYRGSTHRLDFVVHFLDVWSDVLKDPSFPFVPLCPRFQLGVSLECLEGEFE